VGGWTTAGKFSGVLLRIAVTTGMEISPYIVSVYVERTDMSLTITCYWLDQTPKVTQHAKDKLGNFA